MTEEPICWAGDPAGLSSWQRDLYEYIEKVGPAGVAIGNLPASVQSQLAAWDAAPPANEAAIEAVVMMMVITQQLGGRTSGVIGQGMVNRLTASFIAERTVTAPPKLLDEHDPGAGYMMSLQPRSTEPFLMAKVLAQWQELGFPDDLPPEPARARLIGDSLTLPGLGFFVSSATSPNGRFRLAWSDGSILETKVAQRWEKGKWALLDGDHLLGSGRLARPNDGAVSDLGSAVLADWTSDEGLHGDLMFIDGEAKVSLLHHYEANLGSVGISGSGSLAAVSTLHAPTDDSSLVAVWDLRSRRELWRRRIERVYGNQALEFDELRALVWINATGNRLALHLDGHVATDVDEYRTWLTTTAAPMAVAATVQLQLEEWGAPNSAQAEQLLAWLDGAVQRSTDPLEQASLLRWMGEIADGIDRSDKVIEYWRRAVTLNPNVGVKQKLKKIDPSFAATPAGKGRLVAQLDGPLTVVTDWKLGVMASAIQYARETTFVAGLGQSVKGNLMLGDVASGTAIWRLNLPGYVRHVISDGNDGWLVVATEGLVGTGTSAIWQLTTSGEPRLIVTLGAVTTGPPAVARDWIGVGCRDGCLYCIARDGRIAWKHLVGAPTSALPRRVLGIRIGFGSGATQPAPFSMHAADGDQEDRPTPSPYHVTAGAGEDLFVYASGAGVIAIGADGRPRWNLGEPGFLGMSDGSLLIDALSVGPDGAVLIQRRNSRLTLRRPDGTTKPLNPDSDSERQLKGVDWLRNRIWAKDHEALVICDLNGRTIYQRPNADKGWMWRSILRDDGDRLAIWHDSAVDVWDDSLTRVGSAQFAGERVQEVRFAGAKYLVATNKRVILLEER